MPRDSVTTTLMFMVSHPVSRPRRDIIGQRFNRLIVLAETKSGRRARVLCSCDCGQEKVILKQNVVNGSTKSCGCLHAPVIPPGTVFNRWTVLEKVRYENVWKYRCRCSCGTERLVNGVTLKRGTSKSCGCLAFEIKSLPPGEAMFNQVLSDYRNNASRRNLLFDLTREDAWALFTAECFYCGAPPSSVKRGHGHRTGVFTYNGIDRKNSSKGYTTDNCVTSCSVCNHHKRTQTVEEFFTWIGYLLDPDTRPNPTTKVTLTDSQIRHQWGVYRRSARLRDLSFALDFGVFGQMLQASCSYCGAPPSNRKRTKSGLTYLYGGIDRADNLEGYTEENCVPCCWNCNWAKGSGGVETVLAWASQVNQSNSTR